MTSSMYLFQKMGFVLLCPSISVSILANNDFKVCIDVNSFRSKLRGVLLDKFKREE